MQDRDAQGELIDVEITIGRDPSNMLVLESPLVSRQHALIRRKDDHFEFENVGLNACVVGDQDVGVGETVRFETGSQLRVWPFTISLEMESVNRVTRTDLDAHVRSEMTNLEQRIHRQLLERLDLVGMENSRRPERERGRGPPSSQRPFGFPKEGPNCVDSPPAS